MQEGRRAEASGRTEGGVFDVDRETDDEVAGATTLTVGETERGEVRGGRGRGSWSATKIFEKERQTERERERDRGTLVVRYEQDDLH